MKVRVRVSIFFRHVCHIRGCDSVVDIFSVGAHISVDICRSQPADMISKRFTAGVKGPDFPAAFVDKSVLFRNTRRISHFVFCF